MMKNIGFFSPVLTLSLGLSLVVCQIEKEVKQKIENYKQQKTTLNLPSSSLFFFFSSDDNNTAFKT